MIAINNLARGFKCHVRCLCQPISISCWSRAVSITFSRDMRNKRKIADLMISFNNGLIFKVLICMHSLLWKQLFQLLENDEKIQMRASMPFGRVRFLVWGKENFQKWVFYWNLSQYPEGLRLLLLYILPLFSNLLTAPWLMLVFIYSHCWLFCCNLVDLSRETKLKQISILSRYIV